MKAYLAISLFMTLALALEAADNCETLGCGAVYDTSKSCQCNELCTHYGNCCEDYLTLGCNKCEHMGCIDYDNRYVCQCNSECPNFGNCCEDYNQLCGGGGGEDSCAGRCGTSPDNTKNCQCNDVCSTYGDCCSDYNSLCGSSGGGSFDMDAYATKMWELDENRIDPPYYTVNVQGYKSSSSSPYTDDALNDLFSYFDEGYIYNHGTFASYSRLCNLYEPVQGINEDVTTEATNDVNLYLDDVMATSLIQEAVTRLQSAGHVTDAADFRAKLKRAFFELYSRTSTTDSSGFEHCFCGEFKSSTQVNGFHNWVTFYEQEKQGRLNYFGNFGLTQPDHLGVQFEWDNRMKPLTSIMLGVSTEFELAIYMACFFENPGKATSFTITDGSSSYPVQVQIWTHGDGTQIGSAYFIS